MIAEGPFAHDVLQPPRPHLDAVLVADLQEGSQARLQLAGGAGQRALRFQLLSCGLHLLVPELTHLHGRARVDRCRSYCPAG